jgi:hypothetical protein
MAGSIQPKTSAFPEVSAGFAAGLAPSNRAIPAIAGAKILLINTVRRMTV